MPEIDELPPMITEVCLRGMGEEIDVHFFNGTVVGLCHNTLGSILSQYGGHIQDLTLYQIRDILDAHVSHLTGDLYHLFKLATEVRDRRNSLESKMD